MGLGNLKKIDCYQYTVPTGLFYLHYLFLNLTHMV
jgi:hypothetical protein